MSVYYAARVTAKIVIIVDRECGSETLGKSWVPPKEDPAKDRTSTNHGATGRAASLNVCVHVYSSLCAEL